MYNTLERQSGEAVGVAELGVRTPEFSSQPRGCLVTHRTHPLYVTLPLFTNSEILKHGLEIKQPFPADLSFPGKLAPVAYLW